MNNTNKSEEDWSVSENDEANETGLTNANGTDLVSKDPHKGLSSPYLPYPEYNEDNEDNNDDEEMNSQAGEQEEYNEAFFQNLDQEIGNESTTSYSYSKQDLLQMVTDDGNDFGQSVYLDTHDLGLANHSSANLQYNSKLDSVAPSSPLSKRAAVLQPSTLSGQAWLQTNQIPFYARQEELELLHRAAQRISLEWMENPSEILWVTGPVGVGKTTLVKQAIEQENSPFKEGNMIVCRGTSEQQTLAIRPFKALSDCLNDLIAALLQQGGKEIWKKRLNDALGGEAPLVCTICPKLQTLLELETPMDKRQLMAFDVNTPRRFERLAFAVRDLLVAVSEFHPITMVMDNLQWADADSLHFLQDLFTTKSLQNFLLIALYDPIPTDHPLRLMRDAMEEHSQQLAQTGGGPRGEAPTKITEVRLQVFAVEQTQEILCRMLLQEQDWNQETAIDDIQDLAELVHVLTKGNPLWMLQLIRLWNDKKLFTYDSTKHKWEWSRKKLKKEVKSWKDAGLAAFGSMEGVVQARIEKLPNKVKFVTELLGLLGVTTFSLDQLERVAKVAFQKERKTDKEPIATLEDLEKMVVRGVHCGIFKKMSRPLAYKFSHEVVREAAGSMPFQASNEKKALQKQHDKANLHFRIGSELSAICMDVQNEERERFKFLTVHQLNESLLTMSDGEKAQLAKLNLEAAEIAITKTAFRTAVAYLEQGIAAVSHQVRWDKQHYDTTLRIFLFLARMRMCCGRIGPAKAACDEILDNGATLKDRIYANQVLMIIMVGEGKHNEALKRLLEILRGMGEVFPRGEEVGPIIEREFETIGQTTASRSNPQLLNPRRMKDKKSLDIMMLLYTLVETSRNASPNRYVELATIRMMHLSLKHGFSRQYPMAFSLFGVCLMKRGLMKEAHRMGQVAEKVARISDFYGGEAVALFHWHISHWRRLYKRNLEPVLHIYNAQVDAGDFHHVDFSITTYIQYHLASGFDVEKLHDNLVLFDTLYSDYKIRNEWHVVIPQQLVANLLGDSQGPLYFFGNTKEQQQTKIDEYEKAGNVAAVDYIHFLRMFVAFFFHDLEIMEDAFEHIKRPMEGVWIIWMAFFEAYMRIQYLPTATGKARKELKEEIDLLRNKLVDLYNSGASNANVMTSILDAEWIIAKEAGKGLSAMKVQDLYNRAIEAAKKDGAPHLEAFASERAGLHFYTEGVDGFCTDYINQSHKAYGQCRYVAKRLDLESKFSSKLRIVKPQSQRLLTYSQDKPDIPQSFRMVGGEEKETKPKSSKSVFKKVGKGASRRVKDLFKKEKAEPAPWGWNSKTQMVMEDDSENPLLSPSRAPKAKIAFLTSPSGNQFRESVVSPRSSGKKSPNSARKQSPNSPSKKSPGKGIGQSFRNLFRKDKLPLTDDDPPTDRPEDQRMEQRVEQPVEEPTKNPVEEEEETEAIDDMLESPKPRGSRLLNMDGDRDVMAPPLDDDDVDDAQEEKRKVKKKKKKKKKRDQEVELET